MALQVFDTLRGEKSTFTPIEPGKVRMYVCGITPYSLSHLGHARCYVSWDIVYRYLKFLDFDVTYVRNFTDVDDKIIAGAQELGIEPLTLAQQNIDAFYTDMDALGIARPQLEPRVSESIDAIIVLVQTLMANGHAYEIEGDVFFEVSTFDDYGQLGHRDLEQLQAGARVEVDSRKRNPMDFALWKSSKPGEPKWSSPWGDGRPGWHIECSAMSMTALGNQLDIHGGGRDLIFPHHENEIAQSQCATGCAYVRYWMHNGFINIDQEKMSKSLGNVFNIRDITERYTPLVLRYFLMTSTHYRNPIQFSDAMLDEASARVAYFYETLRKANQLIRKDDETYTGPRPFEDLIEGFEQAFVDAMDDDFSVVKAMEPIGDLFKALNELVAIKKLNKQGPAASSARALRVALNRIDSVLNLFSQDIDTYLSEHRNKAVLRRGLSSDWINARISERIAARTARDWAQADSIREELENKGVMLMDHEGGTDWSIAEGRDVALGDI